MKYGRVLLKLSGEALGDPASGHGIDTAAVERVAKQVARLNELGTQVAIVCGGGNILRGSQFSALERHEPRERRLHGDARAR